MTPRLAKIISFDATWLELTREGSYEIPIAAGSGLSAASPAIFRAEAIPFANIASRERDSQWEKEKARAAGVVQQEEQEIQMEGR